MLSSSSPQTLSSIPLVPISFHFYSQGNREMAVGKTEIMKSIPDSSKLIFSVCQVDIWEKTGVNFTRVKPILVVRTLVITVGLQTEMENPKIYEWEEDLNWVTEYLDAEWLFPFLNKSFVFYTSFTFLNPDACHLKFKQTTTKIFHFHLFLFIGVIFNLEMAMNEMRYLKMALKMLPCRANEDIEAPTHIIWDQLSAILPLLYVHTQLELTFISKF